MSIIKILEEHDNNLLGRKEVICDFTTNNLKRKESIDTIKNELHINDDKIIVPIKLIKQTGKNITTGVFYIYNDEKISRKHISQHIFSRLNKNKDITNKNKKNNDK